MLEVTINGEKLQVENGVTLKDLLQRKGLLTPTVTTILNGRVLSPKEYSVVLKPGDVIDTASYLEGG
ncbi:thiamine biosynthesis protein ThiS [Thermanaeromonas toyohensis ToBE]|uniref:Thiamine biosynthesis protein ThiS n=1 Tax=Thermanaeromonas toyohensis ToBE TaxID=698762 RepID=A0A1W1VVC4_9FIRM|nr:hypothetical protein [Thermanaeromonas toyohensis]SMB97213.1 thiamine biosynthesis protein ThiS [Thermanaeromonas toyohensis ToBE]